MEYTEALSKIDGVEGGADIKSAILGEVSKKNTEAKGLRDRLKMVTSILGVGADASEDVVKSALEAKITEAGSQSGSNYEKRIKALEEENTSNKKKAEDAEVRRVNALKSQKITEALVANKAIKPEVLANVLLGKVKVNENDSLSFVGDDGKDIAFDEGIKGWLKSNPEFVSNTQNPGSGNGGSGSGNVSTVTNEQLKDMNFYTTNREKIISGEIQVSG